MFRKSRNLKSMARSKSSKKKSTTNSIESSEQVRVYLKEFVTIMCLHNDFNEISSIAMDILVDLLEHFIESFFKIMKNLKSVNLFDVQEVNSGVGVSANYYHSEVKLTKNLFHFRFKSINPVILRLILSKLYKKLV